jgi:hypothetical protein
VNLPELIARLQAIVDDGYPEPVVFCDYGPGYLNIRDAVVRVGSNGVPYVVLKGGES